MGGLNTGHGVLKHHAVFGVDTKIFGTGHKYFGVGLGAAHAGSIHHSVKQFGNAQSVQNHRAVFAGGAKGYLDACRMCLLQKVLHTGQQFAFFQLFDVLHIPVVLALAEGLLFILGHCAVADLQDDLQTGHPADAFQALIVLLGKGNVQLIGQALPGQKVIFGGVHDDAVQVKQKSVLAHLYPPVVGWGQLFTSGRP